VDVPDVKYARSGNVAIAYQVVGTGPLDLVFIRGTLAELLTAWEQPLWVRQVEGFAAASRVIMFDKRGTGLSDRVREVPHLETRMDDIRAVLDDLDVEEAALWTAQEGSRLAVMFAATYPERTTGLTLYDPAARGVWAEDYPWAKTEEEWRRELREAAARWGERAYLVQRLRTICPTVADDAAFQDWYVRYMRRSASPRAAAAFLRMEMEGDVRDVLGSVRAPTLVAHGSSNAEEARYVAGSIPEAEIVEIAGLRDVFSWANPAANDILVEETNRFLGRLGPPPVADRVLATVLFTDIVGSTERAAELGDSAWKRVLERHHALVRRQLAAFRGEEVDTAGDGFFATFDGPARAISCARAVRDEVRALDLDIRAGLHTGECELVGEKIAGIAVNVGSRVASVAAPGEVLVSSTVKDLVAGSGIEFEERGEHELKGVPGTWRLYAVRDA
jgi:class 3 adenylate cyclase